jgi:hypothetical protein
VKPSDRWQDGDKVSTGTGPTRTFGKVVVLERKKDRKPFRMIQITGGAGRIGKRDWPDGWIQGQGAKAVLCIRCDEGFYTDDLDPDFCPCCLRDDRPVRARGVTDTKSIGATLRGAPDPTNPPGRRGSSPEAIARDLERDRDQSPFG